MDFSVVVNPDPPPEMQAVHLLLSQAFAAMEGRIDPPSSMNQLDMDKLKDRLERDDVAIAARDGRLIGCLFGRTENGAYIVGKIAVDSSARLKGVARAMIETIAAHAATLGHQALMLQSRIELTENHAAFHALGFQQTGTFMHPGFSEPTSLVFTRPLSPSLAMS